MPGSAIRCRRSFTTRMFRTSNHHRQGTTASSVRIRRKARPADAAARFKKAAEFFVRFRTLAASAYYSTEAGWKALGYVGNVAMTSFDGPPPEVLTKLGIEQTVK